MSDQVFDNFKSYLGNPNLKRSGVNVNWTPKMIKEYKKCASDPLYFSKKYIKIINVNDGLIEFKPYEYQSRMIEAMARNRFNVFATARQAGKTTSVVAFMLWFILFHDSQVVALMANKGDTAREILGRVQLAYQHLPKWLQQGVVEWNKGSFVLENNSRVIAAATSSDAIRGYSINLLFIDEAAFIDNWDQFFTSTFPTISSGQSTKIILVSTPNGLNHFHKIWANAHKTDDEYNGYHPLMVNWKDVPGRDEEWKRQTLAAMNFDVERFAQEYEVEFMGSSGTLIAGWKLKELVHRRPIYEKDGLYKYKDPEKGKPYVLIADSSKGKMLDYSAFHVIDVSSMPYDQVCVFRSNVIAPYDYAGIINMVGRNYNNAALLLELNNTMGGEVSSALHYDYEYENIIFTESAGRAGKRISIGGFGGAVDKGILTSKLVKATGCSMLKLLIEQNQLVVHDFNTISEFGTFSKKNASYEAEPGCHDDLVMGLVLFGWLSNQAYFKDYTSINTLSKLRDMSEEDLEDSMTPFGFIDVGDGEEEVGEFAKPPNWMWDVPETTDL